MIQSYVSMWKNFSNFQGRTRRRDYWLAMVMNMIIMLLIYAVSIAGVVQTALSGDVSVLSIIGMILMAVYGLAMFIPALSLCVRRLHDTDKSGWFYLLVFVPFGSIVVLIFFCIEGTRGSNRFGEDPKYQN